MENRRLSVFAAALAALFGALLLYARCRDEEQRDLGKIPAQERRELYLRELEGLRALCGDRPRTDALAARCRENAEFVLKFPECDAACQLLARTHLLVPTR